MSIHSLKPCPRCETRSGVMCLDTTRNEMYCRCKHCGYKSIPADGADSAAANWNEGMEPQQ